jgi:hypothetical protein
MYTGYPGEAQEQAAAALSCAEHSPSIRHRIKTELIAAAAAATAGESHRAIEGGRQVVDEASSTGQLPLQWAAAVMLESLGAGGQVPAEVAILRGELVARGGAMR